MDYKTNVQLLNELSGSKVITEKTKRNYTKLLTEKLMPMWNDIHDKELNLHELLLNGPLPFISFLKANFELSLASRIRIAICSFFIHTSLNEHQELYSVWKHELNKVYQNANMEHCAQNMPSQRDMKGLLLSDPKDSEKKFIDQEYIRNVYQGLNDGDDDKLYLSFMGAGGLPPVRSTDCYRVHISNGESECPNYIDMSLDPYIFVLRDYKTAKVYKTKKIPLTEEMCTQIDVSLVKRPREYLFVNPETKTLFRDRSSFGKYANSMLRRYFGKNFTGGRMLRHTYVSDPNVDFRNMNNTERSKIADIMGNSQDTIQFNYLYEDTSKWNLELDDKFDSEDEKYEIDIQSYVKSLNRVNDVLINAIRLKDQFSIPMLIYATNPLCERPLNMKGNNLPLLALQNCEIIRDEKELKNQMKYIRLYDEPAVVLRNPNHPNREYLITNDNVLQILRQTNENSLCNYRNNQYYYKVFTDLLRDKEFFSKCPDDYSLNCLQKDVLFVCDCQNKDKTLKNRKLETKTKKKKRTKKKRTKSQKIA